MKGKVQKKTTWLTVEPGIPLEHVLESPWVDNPNVFFLDAVVVNTDGPTVQGDVTIVLEDTPDSKESGVFSTFFVAQGETAAFHLPVDPVVTETTQPYVHHKLTLTNAGPTSTTIGVVTNAHVISQ